MAKLEELPVELWSAAVAAGFGHNAVADRWMIRVASEDRRSNGSTNRTMRLLHEIGRDCSGGIAEFYEDLCENWGSGAGVLCCLHHALGVGNAAGDILVAGKPMALHGFECELIRWSHERGLLAPGSKQQRCRAIAELIGGGIKPGLVLQAPAKAHWAIGNVILTAWPGSELFLG